MQRVGHDAIQRAMAQVGGKIGHVVADLIRHAQCVAYSTGDRCILFG